jgi:CRP/FNR family transcriptional regulator, cyclic AMP receptor protein
MLQPTQTISVFQRQTDPKHYTADQVIFQDGDTADLMYGILDGEVDLIVHSKTVETLKAGQVFGIGALVGIKARPYTAKARTDCQLVFLDERRFLFAIQETPVFALEVMKSYAERLDRLLQSA